MKEAVEEAFAAGLVKVVFATETLSLGINMPARSVVIEKLSKFTGEHHEFLTPGEYTQLTGRAGRRGIDERRATRSCAGARSSPSTRSRRSRRAAPTRSRSSFRPTYNMAANLVRRYTTDEAHHLLNLSFAQFHADRDVVALERQLDRTKQQARDASASSSDRDVGDVEEYRALATELATLRRNGASGGRRITEAIDALRPGDVLVVRRRGGGVVGAQARAPARRRHPPARRSAPSRDARPARVRPTSTGRPGAPPPSTSRRRSRPATPPSAARPPTGCGG